MPTYDYECSKCGNRFEVFQSMKDPKLTDCPSADCGGEVRRLLGTGGGIIFKGSGFYQTDYRSQSYQAGAKADAPVKPEAKSDSKSDTGSKPVSSTGAAPSGGSSSASGS